MSDDWDFKWYETTELEKKLLKVDTVWKQMLASGVLFEDIPCVICGEAIVRDPWGGKEVPDAAWGKVIPEYCRTHLEPWMERRGYRKPEVKKPAPPAPAYKTLYDAQRAMDLQMQQHIWGRQMGQSVSKTDIWNLMNSAGIINPQSYFKDGTFAGFVSHEETGRTPWYEMNLAWLLKKCWAWATKERGGEEE